MTFFRKYIFALLLGLGIVLLGVQFFVHNKSVFGGVLDVSETSIHGSDFNAYYHGGKRLADSESLYSLEKQSIIYPDILLSSPHYRAMQVFLTYPDVKKIGNETLTLHPSTDNFVYPPTMAVLFYWISELPFGEAYLWFSLFSASLFLFAVFLISRDLPKRNMFVLLSILSFIFSQIFAAHFDRGQTDIVILSLITLSYFLYKKGKSLSTGAILGVAALLKLTPAIFIPYLFLKNKKAFASAVVTILLVFIATPRVLLVDFLAKIQSFAASSSAGVWNNGLLGVFHNDTVLQIMGVGAASLIYRVVVVTVLLATFYSFWLLRKEKGAEFLLLQFAVLVSLMIIVPSISWAYNGVHALIVLAAYWSIRFKGLVNVWVYFTYDIFAYILLSQPLLLTHIREYPLYHLFSLRPLVYLCFIGLFLYVIHKDASASFVARHIAFLHKKAQGHLAPFFRFGCVGGAGVITNLIVFYIVGTLLGFGITVSAIIAFAVAVTQNYVLNHFWTFDMRNVRKVNGVDYRKYVTINLLGLGVNLVILHAFVSVGLLPLLAQLFGIAIAVVVNYAGSHLFVFRQNK